MCEPCIERSGKCLNSETADDWESYTICEMQQGATVGCSAHEMQKCQCVVQCIYNVVSFNVHDITSFVYTGHHCDYHCYI